MLAQVVDAVIGGDTHRDTHAPEIADLARILAPTPPVSDSGVRPSQTLDVVPDVVG
ncbi:MAG: hypothetical protein QOI26_1142 [Pseudonocardiales bacterium]|nr:hypothetical protein [Pseudonocardiales bacterium]